MLTERVLFRILGYYDGILILTTNRIRTLDIAVQSRISLAIKYNNLNDKQKKKIYCTFINQLDEDNAYDKNELLEYVNNEDEESPFRLLNGRQIRNVLFSAASLAQAGPDKRMDISHIKKVLSETVKFQQDIQAMVDTARGEAEVGFNHQR